MTPASLGISSTGCRVLSLASNRQLAFKLLSLYLRGSALVADREAVRTDLQDESAAEGGSTGAAAGVGVDAVLRPSAVDVLIIAVVVASSLRSPAPLGRRGVRPTSASPPTVAAGAAFLSLHVLGAALAACKSHSSCCRWVDVRIVILSPTSAQLTTDVVDWMWKGGSDSQQQQQESEEPRCSRHLRR